jgi:hypothetical protein
MVLVPGHAARTGFEEVVVVHESTSGTTVAVPPFRIAAAHPAVSGGMLLALAMNRRARGLRGLDVLRRSQDRAPPHLV